MNSRYQWHVSALGLQEKCGEAYRRRYLEGEKIPPGVALLVGSAVHQTAHADLRNKVEHQALLPAEEIRALARDNLAGGWARDGVMLAAEEAMAGPAKVLDQAIDKTLRLAVLHHEDLAPSILPTAVEQPFNLDIRGYDYQLTGTIDVREGLETIRDLKTAAKSPSDGEAERSLQLTAYALAVKTVEGVLPARGILDYVIDTKVPKLAQSERVFDEQDFRPLLERIAVAEDARQKGVFIPANPSGPAGWICSAKFCGYHPTCRYALRPATIGVVTIQPVNGGRK